MVLRNWLRGVAAVFVFSVAAAPAAAEPVAITSGYIQVGAVMTDFVFTTSDGIRFFGDRESSAPAPVLLSAMPGDVVNLSSSFDDWASVIIQTPERTDPFARAQFSFTAGTAVVPGNEGGLVTAPFTFNGNILLFATLAERDANVNPIARHDLFGRGIAVSRFRLQSTNTGQVLPDEPLTSLSVVYQFADGPAPVPEPATMVLLLSGLAGTALRVRTRGYARLRRSL